MSAPYFVLVREMRDAYNHRLRLVESAPQRGIKLTARLFPTIVPTVREFDLPLSHGALERIWRQHGLLHKRRRKYQRKQGLAHIKATWRVFQQGIGILNALFRQEVEYCWARELSSIRVLGLSSQPEVEMPRLDETDIDLALDVGPFLARSWLTHRLRGGARISHLRFRRLRVMRFGSSLDARRPGDDDKNG